MFVVVGGLLGGGVEGVAGGGAIEEETGWTGSDEVLHSFQRHHIQIQQVTWCVCRCREELSI